MNMASIRVTSDTGGDPYFHFPGVLRSFNTLCGWVDVETEESHRAPDCPECFRIIAFCKSVRIRKAAKVSETACQRCKREVDEDRESGMCCENCSLDYLCAKCFYDHVCENP